MYCWTVFLVASGLLATPLHSAGGTGATTEPLPQESDLELRLPGTKLPRPADAETLFARFAEMEGLEVSFREEKHIALLALPLTSRGKLYFMRPGYLARVVKEPAESRLTISPEELRMVNRGVEEVMDLRQNAELRTFITSLVRVFSGDRLGLERSYEIHYKLDRVDASRWTLRLVPRAKPLTEMLRSLRLDGAGLAVLRIEMQEPSGDRTVTRVLDADPERRFSPDERAALFGIRDADAAPGEKNAGEKGS